MPESAPNCATCSFLRDRQLTCWAAGERVLVEDLLPHCPQESTEPKCLGSLVADEILLRQILGETPDEGEYRSRFPLAETTLVDLLVTDTSAEIPVLPAEFTREPCDPCAELQRIACDFPESEPVVADLWSLEDPSPRTRPGEALPDWCLPGYEILRGLGQGGHSATYLARQVSLGRLVALKVQRGLAPDHDLQHLLRCEAQTLAGLAHPHIVQVYDLGEHEGRVYLVEEYVAGGSLAEFLRAHPEPLPIRAVAEWVEQIARALGFVHQQGLVHRDVKPGNVLLTGPVSAQAKLGDFGLSLRVGQPSNLPSIRPGAGLVGTPLYMAPEQAIDPDHGVGPTADVYSLGVTLYEMLTGRVPFRGASVMETLLQAAEGDLVPLWQLRPDVPVVLEAICQRCLARAPEDRYANGNKLADALAEALQDSLAAKCNASRRTA